MEHSSQHAEVHLNLLEPFQTIDGFGVNINAKYWHQPWNRALLDTLIDDLGATLFRVDVFGKTDWPDPGGEIGPASLDLAHLAAIYQGEIAQRGWGMIRRLNERGIEPYLTVSGDVPRWMLAEDGTSLTDSEQFCNLLVSLVDWAKNHEGLQFSLFGPLNETDLGSPEGPTIAPTDYARIAARLAYMLKARDLHDIHFVLTEQASMNTNYLREIAHDEELAQSVGVVGMHCYGEYTQAQYDEIRTFVQSSALFKARLWMTEFGDLDQTGEREWHVAWWTFSRLLDLLEGGFQAALVWDAFDNYHDHDESWSIYGIMRTTLKHYVPKKRYYAIQHVFRHVRPGWVRIEAICNVPGLRVLAFASPDRTKIVVVGMNTGADVIQMHVYSNAPIMSRASILRYTRTSESENGVLVSQVKVGSPTVSDTSIHIRVPPASIFTLNIE